MKISNQKRSTNDFTGLVRRTTAVAALGLLTLTLPVGAGSTGQTSLYMPQGADAGTANGDYIMATGGLNTYYSYFVEVPPNLNRLVVELFDVDEGAGGAGEVAAQRDRDRGGAYDATFNYSLLNPSGTVIASATEASGGDNVWYSLYDSNTAAVSFVAAATATNNADGTVSIGVGLPAGVVSTDFLLAFIARDADAAPGAVTAPAGWTLVDEGACGGAVACSLSVFRRFVGTTSGTQTFSWTGGQQVTGAILAYRNVNTGTPLDTAATTATGAADGSQAPAITTVTNNSMVVRAVVETTGTAPFTPPAAHTERFDLETTGAGATAVASTGADFVDATAGANAAVTFTNTGATTAWRGISIALRPGPANGHYEIRVDSPGGDDLNALGIRAHDGTSGSGGTELPVYYDSHTQFGVNPVADPTIRNYDVFPWVTNGCQGVISTFDFDANNGGSQGSIGLTSPLSEPGGTAYTQTVADAALSGNDVWVRNTFGPWTTDFRSTRYGIWRADVEIRTYTTPALNGNYTNMYMAPSTQPADPPSQPEVGVYRIYLPTDVSDTTMPVKPYIEQLITWVSGPNPPAVNTLSVFQVTIRVVNPTLQPITFSATNVVTANIPGAGATYGGSAAVSQGTVLTQPAVNGIGDITWNPGTVAAGNGDATIDNAEIKLLTYLVRVTPTSAGQRVVATGTPASGNGTRAVYLDETGNAAQARATYTQGPLCELAITQGVLTKALVTEFRAIQERGQVAVEWATTTEDGTTGFDLYRWNAAKSDWDLVNGDLVMAAPDSVQGGRYRVIDPAAPLGAASTYALMEIEGKGSVRTAGTFTVVPEAAGKERSIFAGDRMAERVPAAPAARELARLSAARGRATAAADAAGLAELAGLVRPPSVGGRLRIAIPEAGLYRLTAADLASRFGVPVGTATQWIANGQLKLENQGQVVPTFGFGTPATSAYFYAQAADSIYTGANVYWLSVASGTTMATTTVAAATAGSPTFLDRKQVEVDAFAATVVTTDPASDYWFWDYLVGDSATDGQRAFDVQLIDPVAAGDAELTVRLFGATDTGVADEHQAEIRVNTNVVGQTSWRGIAAHEATFSFPASILVAGGNAIEVTATTGAGAPYSVYYVDGFELASPRLLRATTARLEFDAGTTSALRVSGFRGGDIALVDVTNPAAPRWAVGAKIGRTGDGFGVFFHPATAQSRYVAESLAAVRRPASMVLDTPSNLHGSPGAQYVVLTDDELAAGATALASYRAGQGLSTLVVRLQDVYDEFGFGMDSPLALRDFLAYAWNEWPTPPRYVTLAGEGSYDYRNASGLGGNKIPALMVSTPDGLFSSDTAYGDVDDDGVAEIAIGRLPVLSPAELAGVIAKIQAYESLGGSWVDQALFVADNVDGGSNFAAESDQLQSVLTQDFAVSRVYLDSATPAAAHDAVVAAIQGGTNYLQYVGHGGLDRFADESVLTNADVAGFTNGGRAPVVAALTCAVNRFELPDYPALGEELVRSATGGATAVFAPSGLGQHGAAREFATRLAAALFHAETPRLGDALVAAQQSYAGAGGNTELLRIYNLLGDSALRMRPPTPAPTVPGDPSGE